MKRLFLSIIMVFTILNADNAPEFDGAYIKTKKGTFIEIPARTDAYKDCTYKHITPIEISSSDFKGILIKGNHDFKYLSLHPAEYQDSDRYNIHRTCAISDSIIAIKSKSKTQSTYFEPKKSLSKGMYVAWIGDFLWFFSIK